MTQNQRDPINAKIMQQRQRCRCFSSHHDVNIRRHCFFLLAILTTISLCLLVNCDYSNIGETIVQEMVYFKQPATQNDFEHLLQRRAPQDHYSYLNTKNSRYLYKNLGPQPLNNIRSRAKRNTNGALPSSLNLESGAREDICIHCTCDQFKNSFTDITCDFKSNPNLNTGFNNKFKVPRDATAIRIILAAKTRFILYQGFFLNNKVNRFIIDSFASSQNQVEIATGAFLGNNGPYPEIKINNVNSVVLRSGSFSAGECKLTVRNSNDLIIYEDSFRETSINAQFVGITDLRIMEQAFSKAKARLRVEHSNIDNLYRFDASLDEICFINSTIGTINSGTFDVNNIKSICFENCKIDAIKSRAITEKLFSDYVSITDSKITLIENEAISSSGITKVLLSRNKIDKIHSNAIHLVAANVTITQNKIKFLDNEWLRVQHWSSIQIADNQFGKFGRMVLEDSKQHATCRFDGNSLTDPLPGSLNTNDLCIFHKITINMPCICNLDWLNKLSTRNLSLDTYCTISDNLEMCFNASIVNTQSYWDNVCNAHKSTLDCKAIRNLTKINGRFFRPEELGNLSQGLSISDTILIAIALLLMGIFVIAFISIYRMCLHRKNGRGGCNLSKVPSVRDHLHEFSKEDRHIIDQSLKLIKTKYPKSYTKINTEIQVLLQNDLSDRKCCEVIIEIVNLLDNVSSSCDDFTPFDNLLAQHLQPQMPCIPEHDGNCCNLNTVQRPYAVNGVIPKSAQQAYMPIEYVSPADIYENPNEMYINPVN